MLHDSDSQAAGHIEHTTRHVAPARPREETSESRYLLESCDPADDVQVHERFGDTIPNTAAAMSVGITPGWLTLSINIAASSRQA